MPKFKPEANLNTIIEISGGGERGREEKRGLKMEILKQLCVPLKHTHSDNKLASHSLI